jgi:hypothetical protein
MTDVPVTRLGVPRRTRWSIVEARTFEEPPHVIEDRAYGALHQLLGEVFFRQESLRRWRGELPSEPLSLFDDREVVVDVEGVSRWSTKVTAEVSFDMGADRVGWIMFSAMTIVGIPVVFAWRAKSIHDARKLARKIFDSVWGALAARDQSPYR